MARNEASQIGLLSLGVISEAQIGGPLFRHALQRSQGRRGVRRGASPTRSNAITLSMRGTYAAMLYEDDDATPAISPAYLEN